MEISRKLLSEIAATNQASVENYNKRIKGYIEIGVEGFDEKSYRNEYKEFQAIVDVFNLVEDDGTITDAQIWSVEKIFAEKYIHSTSIVTFDHCVGDLSDKKNFPAVKNYNQWIRNVIKDIKLIQKDIDNAVFVHSTIKKEGISRILHFLFSYQNEFPNEFDKSLYEIWSEEFDNRDKDDEHDDSPIHFKNECQCILETGLSLFEYSWIINTDYQRVLDLRKSLGYTDIIKK